MSYCSRCKLSRAIMVSNIVVNLCGIGMIVYSLWLLKLWKEGMAEVGSSSPCPRPGFISTLLGIGIVVCLGALVGHMVSKCINSAACPLYILLFCTILICQTVATVAILFKIDWETKILEYLDGKYINFENTLMFQLWMCRLIGIAILIAEAIAIVLATVLWAVGPQPWDHCRGHPAPENTCSFLVKDCESSRSLPPLLKKFQV